MKGGLKSIARAAVRRLVPLVSTRPWLVALAARTFSLFPSVKLHLQRIMAQPLPGGGRAAELDDAQFRVLMDLQDAIASRKAP